MLRASLSHDFVYMRRNLLAMSTDMARVTPEESEDADAAEAHRDEDFDDGCVGDEDSGARGFGGYGEIGDDDPLLWIEDPWNIDGMGPDGE